MIARDFRRVLASRRISCPASSAWPTSAPPTFPVPPKIASFMIVSLSALDRRPVGGRPPTVSGPTRAEIFQTSGISRAPPVPYRGVMKADVRQRAVDKIVRLSAEPKDLASYWQDCTDVVGTVVPYYWTPCWFTLDPASLLITSHFHRGSERIPGRMAGE